MEFTFFMKIGQLNIMPGHFLQVDTEHPDVCAHQDDVTKRNFFPHHVKFTNQLSFKTSFQKWTNI